MAATNRLSLLIESQARGTAEVDNLVKSINYLTATLDKSANHAVKAAAAHQKGSDAVAKASKQTTKAAADHKKASDSISADLKNLALNAAAVIGFGASLRYLSTEIAGFAARAETMGVVIDSLSRANSLSVEPVRAQVEAVKKLGITTTEARESIAKMMFAQLDLRKATELARLSQDAAVIAGVKSSEAFAGIVHSITTRQIRELRTYGIAVTFAEKFTAEAKRLGRELSETEKNQIALNTVLDQGSKIMGTYEAAMTTAGKQVTSLARYYDEARIAVGDEFIPVYGRVVQLLTEGAKAIAENASGFANLATGITAAGAALLAAKFTPGGPIVKGVAAALVGGGVYLAGQVNPQKYYLEAGAEAISSIREKQQKINEEMASGTLAPDVASKQFDALEKSITAIREQTTEALAKILKSDFEKLSKPLTNNDRLKKQFGGQVTEWPTGPLPLGPGVTIFPRDIAEVINRGPGAVGNAPLFDVERAAALRAEADALAAAENSAKRVEAITKRLADAAAKGGTAVAKMYFQTENFIAGLPGGVTYQQRRQLYSADSANALSDLPLGNFGKELIPWQQLALAPQIPGMMAYGGVGAKAEWIDPTLSKESRAVIDNLRVTRLREALSYQEQMVSLLSGPGGEVAAIKEISQLRLDAANREFAITKDEFAFKDAQWKIEKDRQLELLKLKKEGLNQYRDAVVNAFDSLVARGGGIGTFLQSQGLGIGRQVAGNFAGATYSAVAGRLTLPGQGTAENPSFLGKLLSGTPLGLDPLKTATDMNTMATVQNTAAIRAMTTGAGIGGTVSGLSGLMTSGFSTGNPSYIDYLNQQQINAPLGIAPPGGGGIGLAQGIGIAGAGAAGAYGIYSGVKQGGARGALTASGAGLGAAGTIMALAGLTGPAAPILMAAGLGLALGTTLLGDPKEQRREEMQLRIESARITIDGPTTIQMTGTGAGFDYNIGGGMRINSEDQIADAVYNASQRGHKMNAALREAVLR